MAVSRRHSGRRAKIRKDAKKREKWVARKLKSFNDLPTDAQASLLERWKLTSNRDTNLKDTALTLPAMTETPGGEVHED